MKSFITQFYVTYPIEIRLQFVAFLLWNPVHQIGMTGREVCEAHFYLWAARRRRARWDYELVHTPSTRCSPSWFFLSRPDWLNVNWASLSHGVCAVFYILFSFFLSFFSRCSFLLLSHYFLTTAAAAAVLASITYERAKSQRYDDEGNDDVAAPNRCMKCFWIFTNASKRWKWYK